MEMLATFAAILGFAFDTYIKRPFDFTYPYCVERDVGLEKIEKCYELKEVIK